MRAFIVPKGTEVKVIKKGAEWFGHNFSDHITKKDNMFFREDIIVDPVGTIGSHKGHIKTIGGSYARAGYYGFETADCDWIMLAHIRNVSTDC